jgi:hypothetical protein
MATKAQLRAVLKKKPVSEEDVDKSFLHFAYGKPAHELGVLLRKNKRLRVSFAKWFNIDEAPVGLEEKILRPYISKGVSFKRYLGEKYSKQDSLKGLVAWKVRQQAGLSDICQFFENVMTSGGLFSIPKELFETLVIVIQESFFKIPSDVPFITYEGALSIITMLLSSERSVILVQMLSLMASPGFGLLLSMVPASLRLFFLNREKLSAYLFPRKDRGVESDDESEFDDLESVDSSMRSCLRQYSRTNPEDFTELMRKYKSSLRGDLEEESTPKVVQQSGEFEVLEHSFGAGTMRRILKAPIIARTLSVIVELLSYPIFGVHEPERLKFVRMSIQQIFSGISSSTGAAASVAGLVDYWSKRFTEFQETKDPMCFFEPTSDENIIVSLERNLDLLYEARKEPAKIRSVIITCRNSLARAASSKHPVVTSLTMKLREAIRTQLERMSGNRPMPAGFIIKGPSGVGKGRIVTLLESYVKSKNDIPFDISVTHTHSNNDHQLLPAYTMIYLIDDAFQVKDEYSKTPTIDLLQQLTNTATYRVPAASL